MSSVRSYSSAIADSSTRRPFSFASTETVAALDTTTAKTAPTKKGTTWASSRPGAAKAATPRPLDIRSMSDFPTLGGCSAAPSIARSSAPSWSGTVTTRTATVAEEITSSLPIDDVDANLLFLRNRRQPASASASASAVTAPLSRTSRLAAIGTRCFDDGPTDYDGPEEDDDDGAGSYHVPEETEETGAEELNSELAVTRRAGDKSDW